MKKKQYKKPQLYKKVIKSHFFTRTEYSGADMDVLLLAQGSGGGGPVCILPETRIELANNKSAEVQSLKKGDVVRSYDVQSKKIASGVIKNVVKHNEGAEEYTVINGKLSITGNHLVLVNGKDWKMVRELCLKDVLLDSTGKPVIITNLELKSKPVPVVYNLELEENRDNFFAEGLCIHW